MSVPVGASGGDGPDEERPVPWRDLVRFVQPQAVPLAVAGGLSLIMTAVALVTPLAVSEILHRVENGEVVGPVVWLIVALFVVEAALGGVQGFVLGRAGEGLVRTLRRTLVGSVLRWPMSEHDRRRSGDIISRVTSDTAQVRVALTSSLTEAFTGLLTFVGALLLMLVLDPLLLGLTVACVAVSSVAVLVASLRVMLVTMQAQRAIGRLTAGLERVLRAIRTVKLSVAEDREQEVLGRDVDEAYAAGVRRARLEAVIGPVTSLAVQGALVLVLSVGGARLAAGTIDLGTFVAFLLYLLYLVVPVSTLFLSITDLQAGRAALARIDDIAGRPQERSDPGARAAQAEGTTPFAVRLRDVSFRYPGQPERSVLSDMQLDVPEGGRVALVGPSGAGKSTVFSLLSRLYEPDGGTVEIFGQDTRHWPLRDLRAMLGQVEQESPVMAGTLRSNITYARPEASPEELRWAVEMCRLSDLVASLPDGLDSVVGDGGVTLSGGERQRIALCRMLLKRPRILLLDEVTSQLDGQTEALLQRSLNELAGACTVLVIAHRLATVRNADVIHVVQDGRVRARGDHRWLLENDTLYADLVRTQLVEEGAPSGASRINA